MRTSFKWTTIPQQSCHWMLTWPSLVKAHRLFNPAETCKRRHGSSSGDASGGAIFFQAVPVQIHQRVHLFLSVLINLRLYSKAFKIDQWDRKIKQQLADFGTVDCTIIIIDNLPLWTSSCSKGQGTRSFLFHFVSVFTLSIHQRFCTVSFFFPPTLPPWVLFCDVIGWQRGLLGISLAFVYCWFIFLINFSLSQKVNCVLFLSEGIVGELL